ncbi:hypothetical protein B0H10DRAFT_1971707 [Mycena sp. CBHHK59/15]|nr:hypothetical protein B0H10DRAFT_1971707 [Mycena sp. CBHHK59/15]
MEMLSRRLEMVENGLYGWTAPGAYGLGAVPKSWVTDTNVFEGTGESSRESYDIYPTHILYVSPFALFSKRRLAVADLFELKNVLTEGTFFSAQVTMHTYIFYGNGIPSKVYHLYVDKLRVLDKGYGAAWQIPIPSFPVAGPSGPSTPSPKKRKERDDTADDAFEAFDTVTPKKIFSTC